MKIRQEGMGEMVQFTRGEETFLGSIVERIEDEETGEETVYIVRVYLTKEQHDKGYRGKLWEVSPIELGLEN